MLGHIDCHGITNVGKRREDNQDQFLIADLQKSMRVHQTSLDVDDETRVFGGSQGMLLLVADGMGGHSAGGRASSLAVDCVIEYLLNTADCLYRAQEESAEDTQLCRDLIAAFDHCQAKFAAEIAAMPDRKGMGTTLTLGYVVWPRLYIVHVGDSRAYLLRDRQFEQITTDHTLAQQYVESGYLSDSEAKESRLSHVLWNVLGDKSYDVQPEIHRATLQLGDKMLLCTDGLTRHLEGDELQRILQQDKPARNLCEEMVDSANRAGGLDNITVVVAQFQQSDHTAVESLRETVATQPQAVSTPDDETLAEIHTDKTLETQQGT